MRRVWFVLILGILTLASGAPPVAAASPALEVEVCIYGGTPAGIAAALSAARAGRSVALIEPTARIGGMVTSGLSHSDFHSFESLSGVFLDFSRRVEESYRKEYGPDSPQVEHSWRGTSGEPGVNLLIFSEMLAEHPEIELRRTAPLVATQLTGRQLHSATFDGPGGELIVEAEVFIDASYEGDLMASAGVPYRVGREGRDEYGESLAPESGGDELQGYNFRFCATQDPQNRADVQEPPGYRRDDFAALLPMFASGELEHVFGCALGEGHRCIYKRQTPALPNDKFDINDVSRGPVRLSLPGLNRGWPEGDERERQDIFEEHRRHNEGLLYFLQNDEAVPAAVQEEALTWGWCLDEFVENENLPPQLYVREARRMVGAYVYTQSDSEAQPGDARTILHRDAIAMADYGNNCHGTSHEGPLIGGEHHGEFYNAVPPYQIPYGVLVPKRTDVRNLLSPVAMSASHVGFSALRLEPVWTSLGQAAGHAAALAVEQDLDVQDVPVGELQHRLHADGSATIYVSDVLPGHPDFEAVQWWGTAGGFHGLYPPLASPRGPNIFGQYYEAVPSHAAELDRTLDDHTRRQWLELAEELGVDDAALQENGTRGAFIRAAHEYARP